MMSMVRTNKSLRMIVVTMMVIFLIMMRIYHDGYFMLTVILSMTIIFKTTMITMVSSQIFLLVNMHDYLPCSPPMKRIMMFVTLKTMVTIMMAIYQITMSGWFLFLSG